MNTQFLSVSAHRRDEAGLTYVYPVLSRRAGGLSIGVNLNINRACNWACVYCQVEGLARGGPPPIDLPLLEQELSGFLGEVLMGDYLERHLEAGNRHLADIAFSGEGEPTSAAEFLPAIERVVAVLKHHGLKGRVPVRLITNGSLVHKPEVQAGLSALAAAGGEVWFKVDRADAKGRERVNKTRQETAQVLANLRRCAELAPTWIQTCWFSWHGQMPDATARTSYLAFIKQVADVVQGIHLYGLARPSSQPEAGELGRISAAKMEDWGREIRTQTNVRVNVSP
jgi:wyosine [tRNA(Phe)-imidazoG37] synthetase (radical SAM superfamily)